MTVITEWIVAWYSDNVWYYSDVWEVVQMCSMIIVCVGVSRCFWEVAATKIPEKMKCEFIYVAWLSPIAEAHFFLK
jgi:hypothetical protein